MTQSEFIDKFTPLAKAIEVKYRIPYLVVLAQAAIESGWGKSMPGNMVFGIKAGSNWKGEKQLLKTTEFHATADKKYPEIISIQPVSGGFRYTVRDWFRKYSKLNDSFDDYGKLLANSNRYKPAFNFTDPYKFAAEIAKAGYATSTTYYTNIASIIALIKKKVKPEVLSMAI